MLSGYLLTYGGLLLLGGRAGELLGRPPMWFRALCFSLSPVDPGRAARAEFVLLAGGDYAPFLDEHPLAVAAELAVLSRYVLDEPPA